MAEGSIFIFGSSDDLIEVEGQVKGCDEYNEEDATFVVMGTECSTRVRVRYERDGVWSISVAPIEEDFPMVPCSIEGKGYTARARFEGVAMVIREHDDA